MYAIRSYYGQRIVPIVPPAPGISSIAVMTAAGADCIPMCWAMCRITSYNVCYTKLLRQLADYELLILDLGLPDGDGLTALRRWRRGGFTRPVLILTARDALEARVAGLDNGADDYMIKPFALAELLARVRALIRRRITSYNVCYTKLLRPSGG